MRLPGLLLLVLLAGAAAGAEQPLVRKPLDPGGIRYRTKAIGEYRLKKYAHLRPLAWPINKYFCRRVSGLGGDEPAFDLDERGFPVSRNELGGFYHPITIARLAINSAITYMNTDDPSMYVRGIATADKLIELMGPDGAFRYPHPYQLFYDVKLASGWTSAMAQGSALSAFARAYHITCDRKYLEAGNKALAHLLKPMEKGGTATTLAALDPALAGYVWYEEYPNPVKAGYTLNGYMYALLGLHDWAVETDSVEAKQAFDAGIRSLLKVLHLYEYDGFSMYDLAPMVYGTKHLFNPHYHRVHLMQLAALYAITGEQQLEDFRARWYAAVGGPLQPCGVGR